MTDRVPGAVGERPDLDVSRLDLALQTTRWWERGRPGANGLSSGQLAEEVATAYESGGAVGEPRTEDDVHEPHRCCRHAGCCPYPAGGAVGEREEPRRLNVLFLAMAIDDHTLKYGPTEPIHHDGTCTTDCAGDIAARYGRLSVNEGSAPVARTEAEPHEP